ncbi:hypothetical protein EUTSA_v10019097mg [Eutrema salsugineum]|uniref:E3 ubiquitin-protein ligase n=1 Tax=Eutrema salsugineum TaxID=72664 RepID=V4M825_EUTSA|nr:uncharacterized protein LOC18009202 [Eutrema salsugineum]ESQ27301.1 hypothetical protein EUTSA_v10019097mg [Eutrema salsugineum]
MVSRQEGTLYSRKRDFTIYGEEFHNSFKKSKQEDQSQGKLHSTLFNERAKSENLRSITFDFELHLHTPLPSDWQKSIEAKGNSRTSEDHRTYPKDPVIAGRPKMSLDLELNLSPSYSPSKTTTKVNESSNHNESVSLKGRNMKSPSKNSTIGTGLNRSLSWLAFEGGDDDVDHKEQEMVTKVCMKCHMLVMLCTSTPVCPNCKFMHPHDHSSTKLFKSSNLLRLLC